ncbi:nucleotidyl transferase AbiEii/AbiGii toxin family protein [Streptomyces rochei]|uniref:nucleotidyl transferase AbiEii/AbiGii toxin family protein n=1 Tax=Streptomyces TaxID=1883 RepID=UPI001C215910|nr:MULTISPECIES: nucleotidyl transferase AbiEii/AbiGii toxin family protein [unclassified Streptomyces]MBU8551934.1 nucleotidyl transferase AbiEii/AbiGii toxin family protein [Streptomyces sp. Osf17]MBU8558712.1 nucleotidyl transferase AbiEii/AbiGii toxin family protein [Streptomyces sp. Babs14]
MISRDEINEMGAALGVNAADVQRDYVFGWLLAGLYGESQFADSLVLKGGNAFRKGYFSGTRFSGDLDFATPGAIAPDQLLAALNDVCRLVQARTGVSFDLERNRQAASHSIGNEKTVYKYTLYFTDFYGNRNNVTIGLRMDVTEFGRLYQPPQKRRLIHPYSDRHDCAVPIQVVSLEEGLADKLKCLLQRRSSFDLFDLVYSIFVNDDIEVDKRVIITTFLKKTIFMPSPKAALSLLLAVPFDTMRHYWENKIICARESLLDFTTAVERFKEELGSLFSTFRYGDDGELAFFPAEIRTPIMEAGANRTLLRMTYEGTERLVEPYSLRFKRRTDGVGQEYLYAWDQTGGRSGPGLKSLLNYKISDVAVTDLAFEPRYDIELTNAGELGDRTTFSSALRRRAVVRRGSAAGRYRMQCAYCGQTFTFTSPTARLNAHKDRYGNACYGRSGRRV